MILAAIVTFAALSAQTETDQQKVRLGVKAAYQVSWLKFDGNLHSADGPHIGGLYGLMVDLNMTSNYVFSTGVFSNHTGGHLVTTPIVGIVRNGHIRVQYIEIPAVFKLKTNQIGYTTYLVNIGFVPSLRVRARYCSDETGWVNIADDNNLAGIQAKFFDMPFQIGGGIEYAISPKTSIYTSLNFSNGLFNLLNDGSNARSVRRSLNLTAGIFF